MGDISAIASAGYRLAEGAGSGEEAGGGNNFLLPNGTFFVILAIFLVVLGVIGTFVIPPIMRVLRDRENMVTKTLADNKQAGEQFAAAANDYEEQMSAARLEASTARDDARAEGRQVIEEKRSRAEAEVATTLQSANERFEQQGDALAADLRARVDTLSSALASRILGVDVSASTATATGAGR